MSSVSVRPIPGRQILSRALAYRQMMANYRQTVRAPVARSRGEALALAWKRSRGAGDMQPVDEGGTNYGTKQADGGGGAQVAGPLPSPNSGVYASRTVTVTGNPGANLRAAADPNSQILAGELAGTTLTVVGTQQNGWMNVQDPNGLTGWVYSAYLADATTQSGTADGGSSSVGSSSAASQTPMALGGASGGGLLGLAVVGGAVIAAYYLLIK